MARRPHASRQAVALFASLLARPDEWHHGYELMQRTQLKSGTLYPLLMRLADEQFLESEWRPAVPPARAPRHAYRLTPAGREFARSLLVQAKAADHLPSGAVPA